MPRTAKPKVDWRAKLMELLKVPSNVDAKKQENILQVRVAGIGLGQYCGRCGGSGHYSFNPMDGTKCFGCSGTGKKPLIKKDMSEDLYNQAVNEVKHGKLDAYFEELSLKNKAKEMNKRLDGIMKTWKDVGLKYDWTKAATEKKEGGGHNLYIADNFNLPLANGYTAIQKLGNEVSSLLFKLSKTGKTDPTHQTLTAELKAKMEEYETVYSAYLNLAKKIKKDYEEYVHKVKSN